jgi:hypothetical protein
MKAIILTVLTCCILVVTGWCQPNIVSFCVTDAQQFTCPCVDGQSLPDGSPIIVFHDLNGSGPDPADTAVAGGIWSPGTGGCAIGFEVSSGTYYGMIFSLECCWVTNPFAYTAIPGPHEVELPGWNCNPLGCEELLASEELPDIQPHSWELLRAYPNPFNPATTLEFNVLQTSVVELTIFDIQGRHVETIAHGTFARGRYVQYWNAAGLPSGIYWARLAAGETIQMEKLLLLK